MTDKAEFASPEWVAIAQRHLEEVIPPLGESINGVQFSICEVFTNPPAHLAQGDTNQVAWYVSIDGPTVDVGSGVLDDAHHKVEVDYAVALPIARTIYSENPEALAATRRHQKEAAERGEAANASLKMHPALAPALLGLHDHLARVTA